MKHSTMKDCPLELAYVVPLLAGHERLAVAVVAVAVVVEEVVVVVVVVVCAFVIVAIPARAATKSALPHMMRT